MGTVALVYVWETRTKAKGLSCSCLTVSATCWRFSAIVYVLYMCLVVCQELEKPSPPQKPLPADPRSSRLVRSPSAVQGHTVIQGPSAVCGPVPRPARPVPHPNRWAPISYRSTEKHHSGWYNNYFLHTVLETLSLSFRPSPKHPPTLPKPCIIANVKYSSWDFGQKGHCCDKTLKKLHYESSETLKKRWWLLWVLNQEICRVPLVLCLWMVLRVWAQVHVKYLYYVFIATQCTVPDTFTTW